MARGNRGSTDRCHLCSKNLVEHDQVSPGMDVSMDSTALPLMIRQPEELAEPAGLRAKCTCPAAGNVCVFSVSFCVNEVSKLMRGSGNTRLFFLSLYT